MQKYTNIIWDWNGTLLDDVAWCITRINIMLKKRSLPTLDTVEAYHNVFGFPIKDYYRIVGFDFEKEPFELLAVEYIELYHNGNECVSMFSDAREILRKLQTDGVHQIVLSASELGNLICQMKPFGIAEFFDETLGISDIYAASKVDLGKAYIQRAQPERAVLIGDTTHDKEVADALGVDCVLIANGHQSKNALISCGAVVLDCLADLPRILNV